jgi:hypothetical protein
VWRDDSVLAADGRKLAELLRAEGHGLADEICTEIRRTIPEYAAPPEPPVRPVVDRALAMFVRRIAEPAAPAGRLTETCRSFGRIEAAQGGSLGALQAVFRVAFRVAWHRTMEICARHDLPAEVIAGLAEAQLKYMDELASIAVEGYLAAKARSPEEIQRLRRRLLGLVLDRPAPPRRSIAELAGRCGWRVPDEVTPVVFGPAARPVRVALADDVLADLEAPEPVLLVPGPLTAARRVMVETALPATRIVAGVTVPLEEAADALRWARRTLALVEEGVIDDARVTLCDDHLLTLWLMSDPALIDELAERRLTRLAGMSPAKQKALTETLRVWLERWSTAAEVGGRLHVHPQTVRYRLNQLKESLGDWFTDPEARFGLELVLRARRLRDRTAERGRSSKAS